MEDAQIIELFFARSEDAISELDMKYGKLCHKLADNILASAQDAEECVNDAYLSTWNAIPPQRPESLPAFVGTLVRRCSITRYRANTAMKRNSHYDMCMEELETFLASPQQAMEEHYAARELAAAIERFLDTQSKENRVLFMRRYWFSDSCKDIAEFVGLSEKNVSVRLTRIRQKMKDYEAVCDPPAQLSGNHIPALQVPPDSESHGGEAGGSGTGYFRDSSSG